MEILRGSLQGLTDQQKQDKLKNMFGLIASPTVLSLLNAESTAMDDMAEAIKKVGAEEVAAKRMQNFAGTVERLRGSIETFLIRVGDVITPVLNVVVGALENIMNVFLSLPDPIIAVGVVMAGLVAAIGPLLVIIGTLVMAVGSIVTSIGAAAIVISTIGIPMIGAIAAAIIGTIAPIIALSTAIASTTFIIIQSLIPIKDTFMLIKNLISGDLKSSFDTLVNKFGLSKEAANGLLNRLIDLKTKFMAVYTVIKDNLSIIMDVIFNKIGNVVSGFNILNNSTNRTKNNVISGFNGILEPIERLVSYLYEVFDTFGLMPAKVKYANDQTALTFIELNSEVKKNLSNIASVHEGFGDKLEKENKDRYTKMLNNTKKSLDSELKYVTEIMKKREAEQIKSAENLFKNTNSLSEKTEKEKLKKLQEFYSKEQQDLVNNNNKIKAIYQNAVNNKRKLTTEELNTISNLRKESESKMIQQISSDKLKQNAILEQAKTEAIRISREEGLGIIVEANKAYDKTVATAKKKREDIIKEAIFLRDITGTLSTQEASKIIKEANRQYKNTTKKAKDTQKETVGLAIKKANGTISQAERETREITDQAEKVKKVMKKVWNDIKKQIPKIVAQLVKDIIKELGKALLAGIGAAMIAAGKKLRNGIASLMKTANSAKVSIAIKSSGSIGASAFNAVRNRYAAGTNFATGGMALVGENGPELVNMKRGSQVFNNSKTNNILSNSNRNVTINYANNTRTDERNAFTNMLRMAGVS